MPIYDVRPGELIETEHFLSVEELEDAREQFDKGKSLKKIAAGFGGWLPEFAEPRPMIGVYLDVLLEEVGDDAERLAKWVGEPHAQLLLEQRRQARGGT